MNEFFPVRRFRKCQLSFFWPVIGLLVVFLLTTRVPALMGDDWFGDATKVLPPDPVAIVCVNSPDQVCKEIGNVPAFNHPAIGRAWEKLLTDAPKVLFPEGAPGDPKLLQPHCEAIATASADLLKLIPSQLVIAVYSDTGYSFDVTFIAPVTASKQECIVALTELNNSARALIAEAGKKRGRSRAADSREPDSRIESIEEFREDIGGTEVFSWYPFGELELSRPSVALDSFELHGFVHGGYLVVSSSKRRIQVIADNIQEAGARLLADDRRFQTIASFFKENKSSILVYAEPENLKLLLPEKPELTPFGHWQLWQASEIMATGTAIRIGDGPLSDEPNNRKRPVFYAETIATTETPRSGALKAINKNRKVEFPPLDLSDISYCLSCNVDWQLLYERYLKEWERLEGTDSVKIYKSNLVYDPLEEMKKVSGAIGQVQTAKWNTVFFQRFQNSRSALNYSRVSALSGFYRDRFPASESRIGDVMAFMQSADVVRDYVEYTKERGAGYVDRPTDWHLGNRMVWAALGEWAIAAKFWSMEPALETAPREAAQTPAEFDLMMDCARRVGSRDHDPFFFFFIRGNQWDEHFGSRIRTGLAKGLPVGHIAPGAPGSEWERLAMEMELGLIEATGETMGDLAIMASDGEQHLRMSLALFPSEKSHTVPAEKPDR